MNKRVLLFSIGFFALIAASAAYLLTTNNAKLEKDGMQSQTDTSQQTDATEQTNPQPALNSIPGTYVDYSENIIQSSSGTKLLFFHAPWCPQCRAIDGDIKRDGVPDNVTIIKVDYDTNQALRKKYGVTLQTTFVKVDDSGNLIQKYVAYDEPTLASVIKNIL